MRAVRWVIDAVCAWRVRVVTHEAGEAKLDDLLGSVGLYSDFRLVVPPTAIGRCRLLGALGRAAGRLRRWLQSCRRARFLQFQIELFLLLRLCRGCCGFGGAYGGGIFLFFLSCRFVGR